MHILGIVVAMNLAISYYSIDMYKYLALILKFNDF